MTVYNYVRVGPPGGEASIHDAPPEVVAAIESWLEEQGTAESGRGVAWGLLPEPRLGLLVLRHAISSDNGYALGLVHVVAVPEDRFAEPSQAALTGFFESLYGSPLSIVLPKLLGARGSATPEETSARVKEGFAGDHHLEALGVEDLQDSPAEGTAETTPVAAAEPPAHASGEVSPPQPHRAPGRSAAGLALVFGATLGIALAYSPFADRVLPDFVSLAPQTEERLVRLEQLVERLQEQERASRSALAELERSQGDTASQLSQTREALEERLAAAATKTVAPPADRAAAASPAASGGRAFRVIARSARVRAGPSAKERTRGLLGRGQRVVVTHQHDAWLEIEPPPGFRAPAWIHSRLVEPVKAPAEDAALAPAGPPPA